jgi:hypothetical protein
MLMLHVNLFNTYLKMLRRYFEQSFLSHILAPIRAIQENGPVLLQIGQGPNSRKELFMIHIRTFRCKYY